MIGHADAEWLVYAIISDGTSIGSGIDVRFAPEAAGRETSEGRHEDEAKALQRPLPDDTLRIVARCEAKEDVAVSA